MREINNTCPVCGLETLDCYMVTNECWAEARFNYYQNVHLRCLVDRLDRPITSEDFTDVPVNFHLAAMFAEASMEPPFGLGGQLEREERWSKNARKV